MSTAAPTGRRGVRPRTVFVLAFVATLLSQCAWILALPAFHGIDEFDHVYKAAAVARGQVLAPARQAEHGRGGVLRVPADVVAAAGDVCSSYAYTGRDNCRAMTPPSGGLVEVASAAATYNPTYYAVVGTLARPFHGAAFDYALRAFSALACALLVAWAAAVTARWAGDAWPFAGLALAITPVLLYSSSIAAPNGVEYASALLLWASGIALARGRGVRTLVPVTVAACLMLAMHTTGALWLALSLAVLVLLRPARQWRRDVASHRRAYLSAAAVVALVGAACVAWIMLAHTNAPGASADAADGPGHGVPLVTLVLQNVLWPLQALAAFPMRDQPAPPLVYAALLVPLLALLVAGWRVATTRTRLTMALLLAAAAAVPTAATVATFAQLGTAWQGRYSLPLYVGLPLLAAHALTGRVALRRPLRVALLALLACGSAVAVAHVAHVVVVGRPGTSAAESLPLGWLVAAAVAALGWVVLSPVLLRAPALEVPPVEGVAPPPERQVARDPAVAVS